MTSFSYDNSKSRQRFFWRKIASVVILTSPFIIDKFYDMKFVKPTYIYFIIGYLVSTIINDLTKLQAHKIDFDDTHKKVRILCKTVFGKSKSRELPFTDTQLSISSRKRKGLRKIYLIDFIKGNKTVASIYHERHKFNSEDLYHIYKTAEAVGIETRVT